MKTYFIFFLLFSIVSCGQSSTKSSLTEWEKEREAERIEKEKLQEVYADSIVNLSFSGIKLGKPFKETLAKAKSEGTITNVKYRHNDSSATCKASVHLPNKKEPVLVDVSVHSFQDTITSVLIMSDVYETYSDLLHLYKNRYNENAAEAKNEEDDWGDKVRRSGYRSWIWTFKNQSVTLSSFYEEKRENYVKNARMRSPEYRYGVRYTSYFKSVVILYNDTHHSAKAKIYENKLATKEQEARRRKRQKRRKKKQNNRLNNKKKS